ncbi:MAG: chemoreceptor glutamine deamidase CheD [Burkholderiaceae bacterium]
MEFPRRRSISDTHGEAFRYVEEHTGRTFAKVMPGNFYVTTSKELIATTLGSCIAVCLRDTDAGVFGMNHYLLPKRPSNQEPRPADSPNDDNRYGEQAMEALIAGMIKCGARQECLESKIFGGGRVLGLSESVGLLNANFANEFLLQSGIPILAADVGGTAARKIILDPGTGQVRVLKLANRAREKIVSAEKQLIASTTP